MNEKLRNKRVDKAQLKVLFSVPFFAPGVARLPIVWDDSVPTACTNGEVIRWNPTWFDSLSDEVIVTVLCHEVCHPMLGHLWRIPTGGEFELWNQATDHAVNNMLKQFGEEKVRARYADPFPMPSGGICCDPKYAAMSEEAIFAELLRNGSGRSRRMSTPKPGGKSSPQGKQGSGPGSKSQGQTPGREPFGEFEPLKGTSAQVKQQKTGWESTLLQAVAISKGRGDLPGEIMRLVDEMMNPQVPWVELLKTWLREKAEDDYDWMKPNRYFDESAFILPSLHSERMGRVAFATDTSGSIDQQMLAQFQAEKQACLDDLKPAALLDLCCDTRITSEREYRLGELISKECPGGGGTSFKPVFEYLATLPEKPKMLVYLTDLQGTFPDQQPDFPTLWVVYNNPNAKAPFGDVVEVK